jgi:hypothetical protein
MFIHTNDSNACLMSMLCYHNRPREINSGSPATFVDGCYKGCSVETPPQVTVVKMYLAQSHIHQKL